MRTPVIHRLEGLEPDNLLAFLALLGTIRAIERARPDLTPRVSWSVDAPPLRPCLHLAMAVDREAVSDIVARGIDLLAQAHSFEGRADLNFAGDECRSMLKAAAVEASRSDRDRADLLAALMNDAAVKTNKEGNIDPTPLCLLFGQGHQHFLERLACVPKLQAPPARGRGKQSVQPTPAQTVAEALFEVWRREDPTPSFRWDPGEDIRYATMAGDPTNAAFKTGTQHGANRLASIGLPVLRLAVRARAGGLRPVVSGGRRDAGGFAFAWPIWRAAIRLSGINALLQHPDLHAPRGLVHLGVVDVLVARRISVGKFMNFTRARPVH
ncbi:MAG: hypothetical protein RLZZ598_1455 [Pseudomonadota bacterium]|jgi:hypothetical protein